MPLSSRVKTMVPWSFRNVRSHSPSCVASCPGRPESSAMLLWELKPHMPLLAHSSLCSKTSVLVNPHPISCDTINYSYLALIQKGFCAATTHHLAVCSHWCSCVQRSNYIFKTVIPFSSFPGVTGGSHLQYTTVLICQSYGAWKPPTLPIRKQAWTELSVTCTTAWKRVTPNFQPCSLIHIGQNQSWEAERMLLI